MDLLKTGSDWLQDQRDKHLSRTVTYHRGGESVELQATIGRTVFEVEGDYGTTQRIESRDFLVLTASLVLSGAESLPLRGDKIRESAGQTFVYEVMAPGKEPHWRYSDPNRKTLRIHTKQVDVE